MGPDELIEWQVSNPASYELLDIVQDWVRKKEGTYNYKLKCYGTIRSFFNHNRATLPNDPGFHVRSEKPRVTSILDVDLFRRVLAACNPLYRAILLSMFQGGMGPAELIYWSENGLGSLREQLREEVRFIRIDLPGRKKSRNNRLYYTFIGKDAQDVIKKWLETRPNVENSHIFVTQFNNPITYKAMQQYFHNKILTLGIIKKKGSNSGNRYGINLHELRDLFRTRWEKSGAAGTAAEYFMGHVVDPLEYNKAYRDETFARSHYRRAEPWLNILTQDPEKVPVDAVQEMEAEIIKLRGQLQERHPTEDRIEELQSEISELRETFKVLIENPDIIDQVKKKIK